MGKSIILVASSFIVIVLSYYTATTAKIYKTSSAQTQQGCSPANMTGAVFSGESLAIFENQQLEVPALALLPETQYVLGTNTQDRWIEVDKSEQKLRAWDGDDLYLETPVSTGLPWWETPSGEFRIWIKIRSTKMEGGEGKYYYYLPNVPFVMFFANDKVPAWKGYGLHGTYWHDDFGTPRSHGCVNLPTPIAEKLYYWSSPRLPSGKWGVYASDDNPGTRIIIHE